MGTWIAKVRHSHWLELVANSCTKSWAVAQPWICFHSLGQTLSLLILRFSMYFYEWPWDSPSRRPPTPLGAYRPHGSHFSCDGNTQTDTHTHTHTHTHAHTHTRTHTHIRWSQKLCVTKTWNKQSPKLKSVLLIYFSYILEVYLDGAPARTPCLPHHIRNSWTGCYSRADASLRKAP